MTSTETESVQNPEAVLAELRRLQEDFKSLKAERDKLVKEAETLRESAKEDVWRLRALAAETKTALNSQGIKDVDRVMKYVNTDGLDFDENGKLTGLDERLAEWKKDLPEIFDAKRRAGGKGDIFADSPAEAKMSSTEAQVARLFNR